MASGFQLDANSAEAINAATPAQRDRYMDFLRVFSIGTVVVGHWLMAIVENHDGHITGTNALLKVPQAQIFTWIFQVMPLFFFVGGFAHSTGLLSLRRRGGSYADFVRARAERLMRPTVVFLAVWTAFVLIIALVGVGGGIASFASGIVVQPLWFVGVYLAVIALSWPMFRLHEQFGGWVVAVLFTTTVLLDVVRFGFNFQALSILSVATVWLAVHQLGFLYADGALTRSRVPLMMVVGGLTTVVTVTLVLHWYPVSMVGLPGEKVSNMSPPTVALTAHAVWLIGLALMLRKPIGRWLERAGVWARVVLANRVVMTTFLWHLTALFLVYGVLLGLNIDPPAVGGGVWWATRVVWLAILVVVCAILVAVFSWAEKPAAVPLLGGPAALAGGAMATMCIGVLGVSSSGLDSLYSGRTVKLILLPMNAAAGIVLILTGWWALRRFTQTSPEKVDKSRNEMLPPASR